MRQFMLTVFAVVTLLPTRAAAQALDPARVVGRWSGNGSFFDADLQRKIGSIPFVIELSTERSGTGRVGQATLSDVRVKPKRREIELRAKLASPVASDPAVAKERLVLIITAVSDSTIEAEFHLKSNFVYDPRLRQGRVTLARVP